MHMRATCPSALLFSSLLVLLLTAAAPAQALSEFHFGGRDALSHEFDYESHGIKLSVTASADGKRAKVYRGRAGLGVYSGYHDDKQVDGWGPDEALHFLFDQPVHLYAVKFTYASGYGDDWSLDIDGDNKLNDVASGSGIWYAPDHIHGDASTSFDFYADHKNDDFKIKAIWVKKKTPPIPEPSAALVFAVGLAVVSHRVRRGR